MQKVHPSLLFPAKQLIVDIVNKLVQNMRKYGLLCFRILGRHNHRINTLLKIKAGAPARLVDLGSDGRS